MMSKASSYLPAGFRALTVSEAATYIEFLQRAFDAVELNRSASPDGRLLNASVRIADSVMMIRRSAGPLRLVWAIATHVEDLTAAEIETRRKQMFGGGLPSRT